MKSKEYIGDGVYAAMDEYGQIVLTAENGVGASDCIYLEPEVWTNLNTYVTAVFEQRRQKERE